MAKSILAVPVCSHNPTTRPLFIEDTARLAGLFLMTYQYHFSQPETEAGSFIAMLQQLVGLGYRACRAHSHCRQIYNGYRQQFLQYDNGDFRKHLSLVDTFAENLAKMVYWAVESYQASKYPEDYEHFVQLLESLLNPQKMVSIKQQAYGYQLLEELRDLC